MVIFTQLYIIYEVILTLHNPITIIIQATGNVKRYSIIVESMTILCLPISWGFIQNGISTPIFILHYDSDMFYRPHCSIINSQRKLSGL